MFESHFLPCLLNFTIFRADALFAFWHPAIPLSSSFGGCSCEIRAESHRTIALGRAANGAVQLLVCEITRWDVYSENRGHRPESSAAGERERCAFYGSLEKSLFFIHPNLDTFPRLFVLSCLSYRSQ